MSSAKPGDLVKRWPIGNRSWQSTIGLVIDERKVSPSPYDTVKYGPREVLVAFAPGEVVWILETILEVMRDSPQ